MDSSLGTLTKKEKKEKNQFSKSERKWAHDNQFYRNEKDQKRIL